jgi:hypothetical protein
MRKPRTSIDLDAGQIANLNAIAATVKATARAGSTHGKPSWRVLVKSIANGKVFVVTRKSGKNLSLLP